MLGMPIRLGMPPMPLGMPLKPYLGIRVGIHLSMSIPCWSGMRLNIPLGPMRLGMPPMPKLGMPMLPPITVYLGSRRLRMPRMGTPTRPPCGW